VADCGKPDAGTSKIDDAEIAAALDDAMKAMTEGWTDLHVERITQDGVAGRDATGQKRMEGVTVTLRVRAFLTRSLRLYSVSSLFVGAPDQANAFLASFVIQKSR